MKRFLPILILAAAGLVSACASPSEVTRNAHSGVFGMAATAIEAGPGPTSAQVQDWDLAQLVVNVPQTLTVSEENRIKPRSDIVWHGDPYGDRYAQVTQVMSQPLQSTLARMDGDMPVIVRLDVTRFHAQTPRVRYTFGGEHEIEFDLTVIDATTGRVLMGPTHHDLTFRAYGGDEALAAEARGMGQRERIQGRMSQWALQEFGLLGTNEAIPDIGS